MPTYDVCICYHPKDELILEYCILSIRTNLPEAKTIYIISKEKPDIENVVWIPESYYPFSKEDVASIISIPRRVGWYYQQLLKFYAHRVLPSNLEHILILDADVIIKKEISFFKDTKILLSISAENHEPYYHHMTKVIPELKKQTDYSGIVHHMMTKRSHVEEILTKIERLYEKPAWLSLLERVDPEHYKQSGMSEYEILFNYCLQNHPSQYETRVLPFANCATFEEFKNVDVSLVALHSWVR